jgi:hypothetical protein
MADHGSQRNVQYRYAFNSMEEVVDVFDLERAGGKRKYLCIGCGNELIAILGEKRVKHFRHKKNIECNLETYLHRLAKHCFFEEYKRCLQNGEAFWVERQKMIECNSCPLSDITPCIQTERTRFDLTHYFPYAFLEKSSRKDKRFRPDILLCNKPISDGQSLTETYSELFIEIYKTHSVSQEKIDSKIRIIETNRIESEDNIKFISDERCFKDAKNADFYNFRQIKEKEDLRQTCRRYIEWQKKQKLKRNVTFELFHNIKDRQNREQSFFIEVPISNKHSDGVPEDLNKITQTKTFDLAKHFDVLPGGIDSELVFMKKGQEDPYVLLNVVYLGEEVEKPSPRQIIINVSGNSDVSWASETETLGESQSGRVALRGICFYQKVNKQDPPQPQQQLETETEYSEKYKECQRVLEIVYEWILGRQEKREKCLVRNGSGTKCFDLTQGCRRIKWEQSGVALILKKKRGGHMRIVPAFTAWDISYSRERLVRVELKERRLPEDPPFRFLDPPFFLPTRSFVK